MSGEYDPEATVEFDPIRPYSEVEEEIIKTAPPDQVALEGLSAALPTRKYRYEFPPEEHWGEGYGMGC